MALVWTGIRYCLQALAFAIFGKLVAVSADHVMKEAPDLFGVGRYHVTFTRPDGTTRECRLPWKWAALLFVKIEHRRHYKPREPKTVYRAEYATVTLH